MLNILQFSSRPKMLGRALRAALIAGTVSMLGSVALTAQTEGNSITYVARETVDIYGDPLRGSTYDEHRVHHAQFEPLIYDFNGRTGERGLQPGLATSWEAIDDNTWRFELRQGVTFHNGQPFNADAVKFTIDRAFAEGFPGANKFLDVPIERVEVIDEYTVDIITSEPVPIMPTHLTRNGAYILEPTHYANLSYEEALTSPMGTGPYRIIEFVQDERIVMEKNENYWGFDDLSNIDQITIRFIPELSTAVSELLTGAIDIVHLTPELVNRVNQSDIAEVAIGDGLVRAVVMFNLTVNECLADTRVRQALNYAVNRAEMVDAFAFGRQEAQLATMVNPPNNHPDLKPYPYDPDRAKELLAEAGCENMSIPEIDVMQPQAQDHAEAVAAYWQMVGVNVGRVSLVDPAIMTQRWRDRALGVHSYTWSAAENTPETDMYAISDLRDRNSTHWFRQDFEDMYAELLGTMDPARRDELNRKLQEIQHEDPPGVFLYQRPNIVGISKRLGGYTPYPALIIEDWRSLYIDSDDS